MAIPSKSTKHTTPVSANTAAAKSTDAITLLKTEHVEVKACFKAYQKLVDLEADADERQQLAAQICSMLTVHATIEEDFFPRPVVRPTLIQFSRVGAACRRGRIGLPTVWPNRGLNKTNWSKYHAKRNPHRSRPKGDPEASSRRWLYLAGD